MVGLLSLLALEAGGVAALDFGGYSSSFFLFHIRKNSSLNYLRMQPWYYFRPAMLLRGCSRWRKTRSA
jgi:hypothetical protein